MMYSLLIAIITKLVLKGSRSFGFRYFHFFFLNERFYFKYNNYTLGYRTLKLNKTITIKMFLVSKS